MAKIEDFAEQGKTFGNIHVSLTTGGKRYSEHAVFIEMDITQDQAIAFVQRITREARTRIEEGKFLES